MPAKLSESRPGEKLLTLYTFLMIKGGRSASLGELAGTLGCSKQTVLRLLDQLESSGYGKLEPPTRIGREHYYRLAAHQDLDIDIGVEELAQLALCRNLLLSIMPGAMKGILEDGGEKAAAMKDRCQIYTKGRIDYSAFQEQYARLMRGIRQKRVCNVAYRKHPRLEPRSFLFAPMRLISYHETISFLGWEVEDRSPVQAKYPRPLTLHLHRCGKVKLTRKESLGLEYPRMAQGEGGSPFGIMAGQKFMARILFAPQAAAYVHDRQWSDSQSLEWTADGGLVLSLEAQSPLELVSWILSFGKCARALEPQWLCDELASQANFLASMYSGQKEG